MVFVKIFFGCLFLLAVAVQYNDPDPVFWMVLYGVAALITFTAIKRTPRNLAAAAGVAYILGAMYWVPKGWQRAWIDNEEVREAGGLVICGVWLLILAVVGYYEYRNARKLTE